jgi:Ser-tRNA(Ala) deacylase AlaX
MAIAATTLTYMVNSDLFSDTATIQDIITNDENKIALILDQTIFYPQGGGQPYDTGTIRSTDKTGEFTVDEVRFKDGIVYHFGSFTASQLQKGHQVQILIDKERRILNSKYHSAGHLIDIALTNLGYTLKVSKGYHFPIGAYDEYEGILDEQVREKLKQHLEDELTNLIKKELPIKVNMATRSTLQEIAAFIPENLPEDKPTRVMIVEGYQAIPCGGTHASNTKNIGHIVIEKIKNKKGSTRISYRIT